METTTPVGFPPLCDLLSRLMAGYGQWYDFDRDPTECLEQLSKKINGTELAGPDEDAQRAGKLSPSPIISAALHEEQGAYLLTRKATMWESHSHEFVYFFLLRSGRILTEELFTAISAAAISLGRERVHPDANHIRSEVVSLIIAEEADEAGLTALKKWSCRENFKMSLYGWMDGLAALITPQSIVTSKGGGRLRDFLESILYPDQYREKNRGWRGWLRKIFR